MLYYIMSEGTAFSGISSGYDSKNVFKYRNEAMCNKWKRTDEEFLLCKFEVYNNPNGNYQVHGTTKDAISNVAAIKKIYAKYWASNKPTYSESYAGSGMPYATEKMAFDNTENKGIVPVEGINFSFKLDYPNSYYKDMGKTYVPPQANVVFVDENQQPLSKVYQIKLGNGIPFRSLTWPRKRNWNNGPMFYCNSDLPIRTQAQILEDSSYPCTNQEPKNFWGSVPPN